mgnify:CR=1 FL=1
MRVVLRNVCKDIKGARVLDNVNLELESGRVYGFKGKNGSGKTSILSELHPFASCGNMDVRSDVCLIKEGCDGYKEIHIQDLSLIHI